MNILVVESNAKAKTIQRYLGKAWTVLATGGHIQELPSSADDPKEGKKAYWANRPGELPKPPWSWTPNGEKAVRALLAAAEKDDDPRFFLATDPDREGEFIAWRLAELLADVGPTRRVTFQEVTREAVLDAIAHARDVDMDLVHSAMVRRFLDRLVGFRASKLAKSYVAGRTASMGRVQTPTLGFIVDRELEREAHVPVPYFEVTAHTAPVDLKVRFHEPKDDDRWQDEDGRFVATRTAHTALAEQAHAALVAVGAVTLTAVEPAERQDQPKPPFSTDGLLQAVGGRWGWSPKKAMKLASDLYEAGHITYIRTDSTRMSEQAVDTARALIATTWGEDHLGPGAVGKQGNAKVQDAHEAIRPTHLDVAAPDGLEPDALRLYTLIRAQVLGSQMAPSRRGSLRVTAAVDGLDRPLTGSVSWTIALGWRAAFAGLEAEPVLAPPRGLDVGARLPLSPSEGDADNPALVRGETQPPPRYRGHTLIKAMKEAGIGRPSTYAATLEKLLQRAFVTDDGGALAPTLAGRQVWLDVAPLYGLPSDEPLFDVSYTAAMEDALDQVEEGIESAPEVWERLRDAFRAAHEVAQAQRRNGKQTPAQRQRLDALLANAPAALIAGVDVDALSWEETGALLQRLRDAGVSPAPSDKQRSEVQRLIGVLGLDDTAAAALVGLEHLDALQTAKQVSDLIDALRARLPDVTAPSAKQLAFVASLAEKAGLSEADACGRVGAEGYAALTGGRDGTASQLITALKRERRAKT